MSRLIVDQIEEERSEYDNEIDAFHKNQKKLESKAKRVMG